MTETTEQIRAVFLALVVVVSILGGTMAFAGGAAAEASSVTGAVSPTTVAAETTEDITVNVTATGVDTSNATVDGQVALNLSDVGLTGAATTATSNNGNVTNVTSDVTEGSVVVTFDDVENSGVAAEDVSFTVGISNVTTPTEGEYNISAAVDSEGDGSAEVDEQIASLTVDGTGPSIENAQLSDTTDGNGLVADGETVRIEANVTDDAGVESVQASAEAFGLTHPVNLTTTGDGLYTATFEVDGANATDGGQFVDITATDGVGNEAQDITNDIEVDVTAPENQKIDLRDEDEVVVQSYENLDLVYEYIEENTENATITLEGQTYHAQGETYTYELNDDAYIENASKSITLDLDEQLTNPNDLGYDDDLADGAYSLTIEVEDEAGNVNSTSTTGEPLVVDDERPNVNPQPLDTTDDVSPDGTVEVTYDYADATNASELRLGLIDTSDGSLEAELVEAVDHGAGQDLTQTFNLGDATIDDNSEYDVFLMAVNEQDPWNYGHYVDTIDVNANAPSIENVEANAGEDRVTVEFSEAIGDSLDRTDLAYQDVSGDGASAIDYVRHSRGSAEATLYLDADVSANDLGTDVVNARSGEIPDTADHDPRYVDSGVAVALADTTAPTIDEADITAETITQQNDGSYTVDVSLDQEVVDVTVTVGNDAEATADSAQYYTTVSGLNTSGLSEGSTTIAVLVTDKGGNTDQATTTVEKDTVSPSITSVQADAGTDDIKVTFDEEMSDLGTDAFDLNGVDTQIDYVHQSGNSAFVDLADPISFDEINNSDVTITATAAATDAVGNPAAGTPAQLNDTENPHLAGLDASANDANVTVEFTEGVVNASGEALSADDFVYNDVSGDGASAITGVDHVAESTTAVVTLDAAVTASDLSTDELGIAENAVYDANDSAARAVSVTLEDSMAPDVGLSADVDGDTITYTVESNEELDAIDVTVGPENKLATEGDLSETLTAEDFELQSTEEGYVYTANYTAPRDGAYHADLITAEDLAGNDGANWYDQAAADVDTAAPSAVDAVLTGSNDDRVTVHFDEPISAGAVDKNAVSVEGASVDYVNHWSDHNGVLEVELEEPLQTGDEPNVTVDGASFHEATNDWSSGQTESVTVHTGKLALNEGTNFVSVPAISGGQDLGEVDTSNVDVIWTYTGDSWESYNPDNPESDFTTLKGGQGYIVEMNSDDVLDLNVYNQPASSTGDVDGALMNQQQLEEGWNLVGHYQTQPLPPQIALNSVNEDVHLVYGQSSGYEYELVNPNDIDGPEDLFMPGESYWVFVTEDTVYTHPSSVDYQSGTHGIVS